MATHPERISGLVLINSYARYLRDNDYLWGVRPESLERVVAASKERWGDGRRPGGPRPQPDGR